MAAAKGSRSVAPRLAGAVVFMDGLVCFLAAGALVLLSSIFRPIGAIEGREPVEQSWFLEALIAAVLAIGAMWSGQRAIRGIRRGRLVAASVAGLGAVLVGWLLFIARDELTVPLAAAWLAILAVHVVAAVVLFIWAPPPDGTLPVQPAAVRNA
ncbi:MAG TPA: hypothetical protein VFP56_04380 [Candidatus Limnocylindrales bacterium]|nr:hypothetical protein [Candidatus Limnocylindrales bacterium]